MDQHELIAALQALTPEQVQGLLSQNTNGRSPMKPRQLHDLRLAPTATDPRPLFIPSAEGNRDVPERHTPYPKLLWHRVTQTEITVQSEAEHRAKSAEYADVPPNFAAADPVELARAMFDALSPEDQQVVIEQQRKAKVDAVTSQLGRMTASQQAAALAQPPAAKPRKTA